MSETDVTFHFDGEDDTLGNLLKNQLLKNDDVIFAAYKVPHPLTRSVEVRVNTMDESVKCIDALKSAVNDTVEILDELYKLL